MSLMKFQTVERDSLFTRLDFRSKVLMIAAISIVAYVWESPVALAVLSLALVATCLLAGVKASYIRMLVTLMAPFYLLLLATHGFWNTNQVARLTGREMLTPLFSFPDQWWLIGGGAMSAEGLLYGVAVVFKTLSLVLVIPLAVFTSDVDNMIVAMVRARVPYKLVFVFSSTLRFFPLLFEEIQAIVEAQRLRGLALETMGPVRRVRVYSKVAVPLILGAMVKSQELEIALQSRGFTGSSQRTYLHESVLQSVDWIVILLFTLLFVLALVAYFTLGVGRFTWLLFS